jgi:hypothetical protein
MRSAAAPRFSVARWWATEGLSDIERVYFDAIRGAKSLLDVGAGDLRVRDKFVRAGFEGVYETQDVGGEFAHTYRSIDQVTRRYDAVLCLDVLEHLRLDDGLALLDRIVGLLEPGGVLVVQTPNGRCVRNPLGWDMTHRHLYNLADLWAHLRTLGLEADGYRIWFAPRRLTPWGWARSTFSRFVTTKVLGCDYADNIGVVARRRGA